MNKLVGKATIKPEFWELAKVGIGVVTFLLLLLIPPPRYFSQILYQPHWLILIILFIFFTSLFRKNGDAWEIIQAIFVFALFAVPLIYKWQTAYYDGNLIGGLLPWSDASGYYADAHRLNLGIDFSSFSTRRPLFAAFFSVLLRLTGGNLMVVLAWLTLINVLAVFFNVSLVKRIYGSITASIFLIFAFLFYKRFSGQTLTEQLGFALGNLALFFLLASIYKRSLKRALLGLGLLTLALNARAGAFFILPALIFWMALYFGKKTYFLRVAALAGIVVIIGFLTNLLLIKSIGSENGTAFSNFPYVIYSLASGNTGWNQVIKDYPNVTEDQVMPLAIHKIHQNPGLFMRGIIRAYGDYFSPWFGAFCFIYFGSSQKWANIILWGCVLVGFGTAALDNRRKILFGFSILSFLGIFASAGMAPPNISDSMRAFAATMPFTALWVASGISAVFAWGRKQIILREPNETEEKNLPFEKLVLGFSVLIVVLAVPAPLLLGAFPARLAASSISQTKPDCAPTQEPLHGFIFEDTSVILIQNDAARESYMPFIRVDDFRSAIKNSPEALYPILEEELSSLRTGYLISFSSRWDDIQKQAEALWTISKFPLREGEFDVCGHRISNEWFQNYNFYYLASANTRQPALTFSQRHSNIMLIMRLLYGLGLWLVVLFLMINNLDFKQTSLVNYFYAAGVLLLIVQSIFMNSYVRGILPIQFSEQRIILLVKDAMPEQGNLYILPLGTTWMDQADLGISPAVVYENRIPLQFPNSAHQIIRDKGNGRYSVWKGYLYFSSSDNSDPRTNGRVYEIRWPRPVPPVLQWTSYLLGICSVAIWLITHKKSINGNSNS